MKRRQREHVILHEEKIVTNRIHGYDVNGNKLILKIIKYVQNSQNFTTKLSKETLNGPRENLGIL